jgi:hypothetical protein
MNLNDDVVYRWLRLGPFHQLHPGRSRSLLRYHDRLHDDFLLGSFVSSVELAALESPFDIPCQGPWLASESEGGTALCQWST